MRLIAGSVLLFATLAAGSAFGYVQDSDWRWQRRAEARERARESREFRRDALRARMEAKLQASRARRETARERHEYLREMARERREAIRDAHRWHWHDHGRVY